MSVNLFNDGYLKYGFYLLCKYIQKMPSFDVLFVTKFLKMFRLIIKAKNT
jgi:hypothetical protein